MKEFHISSDLETERLLPQYFYNSKEYIALVGDKSTVSFYLHSRQGQIIARIHFQIHKGRAESHWRAPFGFLETAVLEEEALRFFWKAIEQRLSEEGTKEIQLVSYPPFYDMTCSDFLNAFFLEHGCQLLYKDSNFHVPIRQGESLLFLKPERKRLRKCKRHGLTVNEWISPPAREVYDLLLSFRQQRNIPLNISEDQLAQSLETFPDKYQVFVVKDDLRVVAVSVCVEVNSEVYYHFCLACDTDYHFLSPSVMLYDFIYSYCQQKGYQYLDFGTASIKGVRQDGLFQFKANLGGVLSGKPVFVKTLR